MSRAADASAEMSRIKEEDVQNDSKGTYDGNVKDKMKKLWDEVQAKKAAEEKKAAELAAVPIDPQDSHLVAESLNITEEEAQLLLKKQRGDVLCVLREAVGLPKPKKV